MFKRIAAGIITAVIFPLFYLLFIERDIFTRSDGITDELGYSYTLLYDSDELMFIKSDRFGEILGKWKTDRINGYNYISAESMDVFDGEFFCVLTEINSKDFRASLKTSFEGKLAGYAVCVVKPPRKAYSLASSAFLAADAPCQFSLSKPVFREALYDMPQTLAKNRFSKQFGRGYISKGIRKYSERVQHEAFGLRR